MGCFRVKPRGENSGRGYAVVGTSNGQRNPLVSYTRLRASVSQLVQLDEGGARKLSGG